MTTLPNVESLLERQVKIWELRRRVSREADAGRGTAEGPWITVSRELGSGGTELARRLGRELGWEVFDREILRIIAEHTHTREAVLAHLDERAIGPVLDYVRRVLDPEIPGQTDFLQEMLRVTWGLAKQGSAIIVGRGANWFLDPRSGLRVRAIAPFDFRADGIARRDRLAIPVAARAARANDERQSEFVRRLFGQSIDDPLGYDLIINLGCVDLSSATRIVKAALHGRVPIAARTCG